MKRHASRARLAVLILVVGQAITSASLARGGLIPLAAPGDDSAVPVRKITLYRSGVGFFERSGDVTGDATLDLRFKTEQINDIIKSMVLVDRTGRIESVSYGSKEPIARRLASFGVDIADNPSIPALMNRLRGAAMKVTAGGEVVSGTIMGVEQRRVPSGKDQAAYEAPFLNLLTATGVRSIAVNDISSFELLDKDLAEELNKALAALAEYRADRTKSVQVRFSGNGVAGVRPVTVAYVHEMPVWKTSYRLVLAEDGGGAATRQGSDLENGSISPAPSDAAKSGGATAGSKAGSKGLNLQGWAIVENNTDEDWNDVRLALVSGQPVSFQMDLYEPLYVTRPFIPVPTIPGVSPRAYSGGMDSTLALAIANSPPPAPMEPASPASARALGGRARAELSDLKDKAMAKRDFDGLAEGAERRYTGLSAADMSGYAAAAQASAGEVGEVFQYELDAPVTVERQRSAMIPILNANVSGSRVSIFNISDGSEHPMRGVDLTNDSPLQLLPGPLAVFDSSNGKSAYAGDAVVGHIAPGEKRLLAYAVDLDVDVQTKHDNDNQILKIRIVRGALEQTVKSVGTTTYAFKNKDQARPRAMVVEHAKAPAGWNLVTPKSTDEQTQSHYRFRVNVDAGKTIAFPVTQERVELQRVGFVHYNDETMVQFQAKGQLSKAVLDAFRQVAQKEADLQQIERGIGEIDRQTQEITADQGRIRENMSKIDGGSQLYARYMAKLTEQETKLEDLVERRKSEQKRLEAGRAALDQFVRELNVE